MPASRLLAASLCAVAVLACEQEPAPKGTADAAVTAADTTSADTTAADTTAADGTGSDVSVVEFGPPDCDPLVPEHCAMPWPSSQFLVADKTTKTGYRLQFGPKTLPAYGDDPTHVDPKPYARLDGYGVGTPLLVTFPNLDTSNLPRENDLGKSLEEGAPILWLEVDAKGQVVRKIPHWTELDQTEADPAKQTLFVRPAVILEPATRYVVAMRALKAKDGKAIPPSPAFAALRDGKTAGTSLAGRQARFDDLFGILDKAGAKKADLVLAWDFVTYSHEGIHGTLLKLREDAYAAVGDKGPELKIGQVKVYSEAENADIAADVTGTFHAPMFLESRDHLGFDLPRVHRDAQGVPKQNGWVDRYFIARIPRSALAGKPHGLVQYGHGLNGHADEVKAGYNAKIANDHQLLFFACHWTGMSQYDVGAIIHFIQFMSEFETMPDKLQQGMVEKILLARAMRERFADLPEVQKLGVKIDKSQLFYSGISQGGIYGGTYVALSKDVSRAHLGVPGNNYSLLLQRSSDFEDFFSMIRYWYPDSRDQTVLLSTIQLLWDQVDPVTWYRHIDKEPLPGNTKHQALLVPAIGDYQVAVVSNEILARSGLNFAMMKGWGRPVAGVAEQAYPHTGSGMITYAFGNPWAPLGNVPPPKDALGDPHGKPRKLAHHQKQMVHFFRTGEIIDVCGGDGCTPE